MDVLEHIKTLLRDHERAFIPGFGGFVKEYVPARIDRRRDLFLPPTCTLSFNTRLAKEDGILAERLMNDEGKDFETAKRKVQEVASEWERVLQQKKRLELKGIGIIHLDDEGKKRFEPDPDPELETSAYGLSAFYQTPVSRSMDREEGQNPARPMEEEEDPEKEEKPEPVGTTRGKKKVLRAAAVLVPLLLLLGFGTAIGIRNSSESADFLNVLPGSPSSDERYHPRNGEVRPDSIELFPEGTRKGDPKTPPFPYKVSHDGPEYTVIGEEEFPGPNSGGEKERGAYYIVGGCFQMEANALARLRALRDQGFSARILDRKRKGLHVVAFDSYADRRRAMRELRSIRRSMEDAWLLHQP
jgi:nucleoid DNA-binding protein